MLWIAIGIILVVYIVCVCVSECVKYKYFWQDRKCECDTCPMRYECKEMREDE